ncbi:MAG: acyltransferase [Anaerolineales bacterium]|nr:acyltransferase [Anaerolineales bacterium]MCA9977638.1 acyltransferase [Anaerolineales bacterium]
MAETAVWLLSNEFSKRNFGSCGRGVRIHGQFHVTSPQNFHVGNNVHINSNAFIRAEGNVSIEDNVHISRNLVIYSMNHNYEGDLLPYDSEQRYKPVRIQKNAWIGMNVSIIPGITIGEGAIIGMGTVVSKDVPPLAIVGSAPQQILKYRDPAHYKQLEAAHRYSGMSGFKWGNQSPHTYQGESPKSAES